jgi:hypothetical protein
MLVQLFPSTRYRCWRDHDSILYTPFLVALGLQEILSDDFKKRKIFWKNIAENFPPHITNPYRVLVPNRLRDFWITLYLCILYDTVALKSMTVTYWAKL